MLGVLVKDESLRGFAQIGVEQENLTVLLRKRQSEICGDGGFALVFAAARDKEELLSLALLCAFEQDTELMDCFGIVKAARRVADQQGGFLLREAVAQALVLAFMMDCGEQLTVDLPFCARGGLHRVRLNGEHNKRTEHDKRTERCGQLQEPRA